MKTLEELPLIATAKRKLQSGPTLPRWLRCVDIDRVPPRLQGVVLVAISAFTFSLLSTLIKYASYSMSSMETVFWRSSVAWILNLIALRAYKVSLHVERSHWPALATRCVFGCCGMSLGFYAMQQMVLADASVLLFTSPVMTFFLGAIVLQERIDPINLGFALFSFVGVVFVSRPTFLFGASSSDDDKDGSYIAILSALAGAAAQAFAYVSMRSLKQLHFMVVIHYFLLTATIVSAFSLVFVQHVFVLYMSLSVWMAVLGTGVLGFVGQLFLTRGFQLESAGPASVMRYLDVVFVFVWDTTLLREHVSLWSVLGAMIICGCAVMIAIRRMHHH